LREVRATVETLTNTHHQTASYAALARGKPQHQKAIKDASTAKKELAAAQKTLHALEQENIDALQPAITREDEIRKQVHLLTAEKEEASELGTRSDVEILLMICDRLTVSKNIFKKREP
jgi:hypothetical protein